MECLSTFLAGEPGRGSRSCWSYDAEPVHRALLTEFFAAGLAADERLLYFAAPEQLAGACAAAADSGADVAALMARGAFIVGDVTAAYLSSGSLEPDVRLQGHAALVHRALDDGFAGLRVCSEIAPLLGHGHVRDECARTSCAPTC